MTATQPGRKETELAKLLADGYELAELRWVPEGSAVAVELTYLKGEDPVRALNEALDRAQSGQWVIRAAAVERSIRAMRDRAIDPSQWSIWDLICPSWAERIFGSRRAKL